MPLGKCVLTELDESTIHEYTPLNAVVRFEGNKKPDTFDAVFPMQNIVRENYQICYIQDIIDVTYLRAVYPMQLSCLDESGYNQDPATDPLETRFVNVTTGKFKGHYALEFDADNEGVEIADPRVENGGKIDMKGQFDVHIWFTPNTTQLQDGSDEPIIWSFRRDGGTDTGIELGITGTNGNNASWKAFLRWDDGSTASAATGSDEGLIMTGSPVHMRMKRGQDNLIKVYVNGIEQISVSEALTLQPDGAAPMVFGDTVDSTADEYAGLIHEVRVYCGTDLTEREAEKIRWVKPTAQFMKFAGRIVKIKDVQTTKKVLCESNSYRFTKAKLGGIGSTPDSHDLTSVAYKTILQSAVDEVDSTFTVRNLDTFAEDTITPNLGDIYEVGSFMQFANILLLYSETIMYITPRKNIIIETNLGKNTDYVFDQNGTVVRYNIKNSEENDLKLVNEVILTGRSPATAQDSAVTPTTGIIRTLRRNILQIDTNTDLDTLAIKLRENLQGIVADDLAPKKFRVEIPAPIPHVRYNMNVALKRKNGNNVSLGLTDQDLDETLTIKQLEIYYPNGSTVIKVGENDIDYFDDVVQTASIEDGLIDTTL